MLASGINPSMSVEADWVRCCIQCHYKSVSGYKSTAEALCPSVCLSVCLPIRPPIHRSVRLSICPSACFSEEIETSEAEEEIFMRSQMQAEMACVILLLNRDILWPDWVPCVMDIVMSMIPPVSCQAVASMTSPALIAVCRGKRPRARRSGWQIFLFHYTTWPAHAL